MHKSPGLAHAPQFATKMPLELRPVLIGTRRLVRTIARGMGTPGCCEAVRRAAQMVRPNWLGVWETDQEHAGILCAVDDDTLLVRVAASTVWIGDPFDAVICVHRGVWWARVRSRDPEPMVCFDGAHAFAMVADAAVTWAHRPRTGAPVSQYAQIPTQSLDVTLKDYMSTVLFL